VNVQSALAKIEEDFRGARAHWGDTLKEWRFVVNVYRDKLPSEVILRIRTLSTELGVPALPLDRDELLNLIRKLPEVSRAALFGSADADYPVREDGRKMGFATLLDWHLDAGTRPAGGGGRLAGPWAEKDFGREAGGFSASTVRRWRAGKAVPQALGSIESALFGKDSSHDKARTDLRAAYAAVALPEPIPVLPLTTPLVGRDDDVEQLAAKISAAPTGTAVLIQGGPGVGKTTLCKAIASDSRLRALFGDRRWFVALEAANSPEALWQRIGESTGSEAPSDPSRTITHLSSAPTLLVLDNLDTPWEVVSQRGAVEQALARIAAIPTLVLLASFRGRDSVGGAAWSSIKNLMELNSGQSIQLFCSIAGDRYRDDPYLLNFVAALGGIPLAIELVARRAAARSSLKALWMQWQRIGTELARRPEFETSRLTSLDASIELSLRSARLTVAARRLFALLGHLPSGLGEDDKPQLLGTAAFEAEESLLRVGLAEERADRVILLPPIREYSSRHLGAAEAPGWIEHYLQLAKEAMAINGSRGSGIRARLVPELPNIESAMMAALGANERERIMPSLLAIGRLTHMAGIPINGIHELRLACQAAGDQEGEALCLEILGVYALEAYDFDRALSAFEESRRLAESAGNTRAVGRAIERASDVYLRRSDLALAKQGYEEALELFTINQRLLGIGNCTKKLGDVAFRTSNYEAAASSYREAIPRFRAAGDVLGEANAVIGLGKVALQQLRLDEAILRFSEAQSLFRSIGELLGEVTCLKNWADTTLERGDLDGAEAAYREAYPLFKQLGAPLGPINCIMSLAKIALARGELGKARAGFEEALPLYLSASSVRGSADCHWGLGAVAEARKDETEALSEFCIALPLYQKAGYLRGARECEEAIARLSLMPDKHL
jgi:tetratricopeptide (TPR) repeat protein